MASASWLSPKRSSIKCRSAFSIRECLMRVVRMCAFVAAFSCFLFDMRGSVTSWTVPVRGREGYTSEICLVNDANGLSFTLALTTHSPEEHVWLTWQGQRVYAEEVVLDSPWEGRTTECVLEEEEDERRENIFFQDFAVGKITGLRRVEGGSLVVVLSSENAGEAITCVDPEKGCLLLEIGVGGLVQLFNVKMSRFNGAFITERSGVRKVEQPPPPPPLPLSPPPMPLPLPEGRKLAKWRCLGCGMLNYPSKTVCNFCRLTRKQGPLYKDLRHYKIPPLQPKPIFRRLPQWMCKVCRFRDNFYMRTSCKRCGVERKEEVKTKTRLKKC